MKTLRDGLSAIVYTSVTALNDGDTDGMLIDAITEHIVLDKLANISLVQDDLIVGYSGLKAVSKAKLNKQLHGIWVYKEEDNTRWELSRCVVIEEAIKMACKHIGEVMILDNGQVIKWDIFDEESAFYIEGDIIKLISTSEETYEH